MADDQAFWAVAKVDVPKRIRGNPESVCSAWCENTQNSQITPGTAVGAACMGLKVELHEDCQILMAGVDLDFFQVVQSAWVLAGFRLGLSVHDIEAHELAIENGEWREQIGGKVWILKSAALKYPSTCPAVGWPPGHATSVTTFLPDKRNRFLQLTGSINWLPTSKAFAVAGYKLFLRVQSGK